MLTVPEAARRTRRDPETIRRWIRSGRLPARRIGNQHVIEESDLERLVAYSPLPLPPAWARTATGEPRPDVVAPLRGSRHGRRAGLAAVAAGILPASLPEADLLQPQAPDR